MEDMNYEANKVEETTTEPEVTPVEVSGADIYPVHAYDEESREEFAKNNVKGVTNYKNAAIGGTIVAVAVVGKFVWNKWLKKPVIAACTKVVDGMHAELHKDDPVDEDLDEIEYDDVEAQSNKNDDKNEAKKKH